MNNSAPTEWHYLAAAIMFYTRLPTPKNTPHSEEILNQSRKYFPLVGLLVGSISASVFILSSLVFPASLSIVLMMIAQVLATGAFHEDGFADSCDGFGGGWSKEQVLSIMKDSRLGTYGAIGLLGILALKFTTLLALSQQSLATFICLILVAHVVSRQLSSSVIEFFDYVQDIDQSKVKPITDRRLDWPDILVSLTTSLLAFGLIFWLEPLASLFALAVAATLSLGFACYSRNRIGGYTGDVLGAIQQIAEVSFYLGILVVL